MSISKPPPKRRTMETPEDDFDLTSPQHDAKRRKLRKGTKSCWDCKKRKVRCTFYAGSDTVCIPCRRRGAPCIGQDQPEEEFQFTSSSDRNPLLERMQRVEALLEKLIEASHNTARNVPSVGLGVPALLALDFSRPSTDVRPINLQPANSVESAPEVCNSDTPRPSDQCRRLSEELLKAFPSQRDLDVFCRSDPGAIFHCYRILAYRADLAEHEAANFIKDLAKIPDLSTTNSILIARRMIVLALLLQYFRTQRALKLSEDPLTIVNRLLDTAVRLVTANDSIVGCIEGLECIILEGTFHHMGGNLRRAWIAFRKAMVIGQLMKLDHPNPSAVKPLETNCALNPDSMWWRIVYMDSFLSLMLGLSHGGCETKAEIARPDEKPACKLERAHALVARRIIERNKRQATSEDCFVTRGLDRELLEVAKVVPETYWTPPDFTILQPNSQEALWEVVRFCDQLYHYTLIHLLHLPYLLRCAKEPSSYVYSQLACVNASREILTRVNAFRKFRSDLITEYCRTADFFALMASMTLLLAHVDSHRLKKGDWRAHQRLSDRALVEQFVISLETYQKHSNDNLTHQSAEQLRRLLEVESETARGLGQSAHNTVCTLREQCGELRLSIPYFGIMKIGYEGVTRDRPIEASSLQPSLVDNPGAFSANNQPPTAIDFDGGLAQGYQINPLLSAQSMRVAPLTPASLLNEHDSPQPQLQYPGLAASVNDWAFQGVDAAFFDGLMRGTVNWDQTLQELT